jgi:cell division protein FtsL
MSTVVVANPSRSAQQGRFWFTAVEARFFPPQPEPVRKSQAGTPEIFFTKAIDNSRLVKVADRARQREMRLFAIVLGILFVLVTVYVWQHFKSIEYGYSIQELKQQKDALAEANRSLRLEEASLKDPERIDGLARSMGLQLPKAGQVQQIDANVDLGGPVLARAAGVSVISLTQ